MTCATSEGGVRGPRPEVAGPVVRHQRYTAVCFVLGESSSPDSSGKTIEIRPVAVRGLALAGQPGVVALQRVADRLVGKAGSASPKLPTSSQARREQWRVWIVVGGHAHTPGWLRRKRRAAPQRRAGQTIVRAERSSSGRPEPRQEAVRSSSARARDIEVAATRQRGRTRGESPVTLVPVFSAAARGQVNAYSKAASVLFPSRQSPETPPPPLPGDARRALGQPATSSS